jgi:hypothetical protein
MAMELLKSQTEWTRVYENNEHGIMTVNWTAEGVCLDGEKYTVDCCDDKVYILRDGKAAGTVSVRNAYSLYFDFVTAEKKLVKSILY